MGDSGSYPLGSRSPNGAVGFLSEHSRHGPEVNLSEMVHERWVAGRRVRILGETLAELIPESARLLDVGSGDGQIPAVIQRSRPDLVVRGVDVLVRPDTSIPVQAFDGERLPFEDQSFDTVMFVDVLHHTEAPLRLLREAARVARASVVLKDHTLKGPLAGATLRFMDRTSNRRYGVALPHNYWSEEKWLSAFDEAGLAIEDWRSRLGLYPWPASLLFERGLHFIASLSVRAT
ncbi:MAG: class I SAM-dependent methyltransferase [bacterium]|nr:class I SAM-dependent methyltransferase [bacterium]